MRSTISFVKSPNKEPMIEMCKAWYNNHVNKKMTSWDKNESWSQRRDQYFSIQFNEKGMLVWSFALFFLYHDVRLRICLG